MSGAGWAVAALLVLAGCAAPERRAPPTARPAPAPAQPTRPRDASRVFGGAENVAAVRSATEVEAVRILPASFPGLGEGLLRGWTAPQTRGAPPEFGRREGDAVLGPLVSVAPDDVATLTTVLTATETFGFRDDGGGSACLFSPGVLVRFWSVGEPIDVLICFQCVELAAFRSGRRLCWLTSFGPGYRAVLDAVRRVFPDDEALRALAERRR